MKSGFVAVAGRPNVGKSTLVNALAGREGGDRLRQAAHDAAADPRRLTTDEAQLVLVDLPGWQRPIDPLTERMQETVDETITSEDVDAVLLVVSARDRIGAGDRFVARKVFSLGVPVVIVVNKVDRLERPHRLADEEGGDARRLPRAASGEREDRRRHRRAARRPDLAAAGRAADLPDGDDDRHVAGDAHRRARARAGAAGHEGGGAARDHGRGRRDRRAAMFTCGSTPRPRARSRS